MSRLKAVALVLSGALASMLYCGWLIVGHIESDAGALAEAREEGYAAAEEDRLAIVVDRPIAEGNSMPVWLQTDPQWDYIPYAGGTIGEYGCGLTCAAMAVKYMTLQDITPLTLASFVGDTCLTDGLTTPASSARGLPSITRNTASRARRFLTISRPSFRTCLTDGWRSLA